MSKNLETLPYNQSLNLRTKKLQIMGSIGLLFLAGCAPKPPTTNDIQERFVSAIPLQSSPAQVIRYLDDQKIEHYQYRRDVRLGNSIVAVIRDTSRFNIISTDYSITFRFDDHDQLIGIAVKQHLTGP